MRLAYPHYLCQVLKKEDTRMDPSQQRSLYLRSTSTVSLHERFSQVLMDQRAQSRSHTCVPNTLQRKRGSGPPQTAPPLSGEVKQHQRRRGSVWTRLGPTRQPSSARTPGFWSFRNKYRWRARCSLTWRRRRRTGPLAKRGRDTPFRGRVFWRRDVPTRKQLDTQLEEYMSLSRTRLDQELEDYMSMSRSRLDQQLDEYMLMAGQSQVD